MFYMYNKLLLNTYFLSFITAEVKYLCSLFLLEKMNTLLFLKTRYNVSVCDLFKIQQNNVFL